MLGKRKKMSIKNYHSFMHYLFVNQTIKKEKKKVGSLSSRQWGIRSLSPALSIGAGTLTS